MARDRRLDDHITFQEIAALYDRDRLPLKVVFELEAATHRVKTEAHVKDDIGGLPVYEVRSGADIPGLVTVMDSHNGVHVVGVDELEPINSR